MTSYLDGCEGCVFNGSDSARCAMCGPDHGSFLTALVRPARKAAPAPAPKNNAAEGKPVMSLIPDDVLRDYVEPAYQEGLLKYSRESWRGGFSASTAMDSMRRHLTQWYYDREDLDPDALASGVEKHHLAAVVFWALSELNTIKTRPDLDDRPQKGEK